MNTHPALHRIRLGEATPEEARTAIRDILSSDARDAVESVYTALRSWTWKAMQSREFGDELAEWYRVISASGAAITDLNEPIAHYLEALSHLVEDSMRHASAHSDTMMMSRSHVVDILSTVQEFNGRARREQLIEALDVSSSRLSQLTTDLQIAGVLDREMDGRTAIFLLTDRGRLLLDAWRDERRALERRQAEGAQLASAKATAESSGRGAKSRNSQPDGLSEMLTSAPRFETLKVSDHGIAWPHPVRSGLLETVTVKPAYFYSLETEGHEADRSQRIRLKPGPATGHRMFDLPAPAFHHDDREMA